VSSTATLLAAAAACEDLVLRSRFLHRARIEESRDLVRACDACALHQSRSQAVPWDGEPAPVMFVGEAPGEREDALGRPFVGRSGVLLESVARRAGLVRSSSLVSPGAVGWAVTNVVCCRPPGKEFARAVQADAPERCRVHRERALELSGAWAVVLVGNQAFEASGMSEGAEPSSRRGTLWWGWDRRLYTLIYHPAFLLRNGTNRALFDETERALRRLAEAVALGEHLPPARFGTTPLADTRSDEFTRLERWFRKRGWAVFHSAVLGESVAVVKDRDTPIPDEYSHLARYTPDEVARMRGQAEFLRRVHAVKLATGGTVQW
jgi:uracil-DNA glycosylase